MSQTAEELQLNVVNSSFMLKVFYVFAGLAALSGGLSFAGKWLGASIAMAGHTDDSSMREIVIGNNVIAAPANAIRFERQRTNGVASRLDLYFRYPQMEGYSREAAADFNHAGDAKSIVFVSFESRMMSRDMSGRFEPIYKSLIVEPPTKGPAGLSAYGFDQKSGYLNESLLVGARPGEATPYVARCLTGAGAEESLAPCERDIQLGDELSMTYRFPKELLPDWQRLDAAILAKAGQMLRQ